MADDALHLFDAFGIELEYMIVDDERLNVAPRADWLLCEAAGEVTGEWEHGDIAWNNELALHVIELKTNGPAPHLANLADKFQGEVETANRLLEGAGLALLPTAMHPWMDPLGEVRLWPHELNDVYRTFDRIFDCRGHGWGNLQSMHLNLPFADDAEFGRLHAAIRLVLPLLPGIAASSPLVEGQSTGLMDNRLEYYRHNCSRIRSVTGAVIPEPVFGIGEYHDRVLETIYRDLAAYDPAGILRHEWVNARGAIARFDRMAIEIRVLDVQECPRADIALAELIVGVIRGLTEERWCGMPDQRAWGTESLAALLLAHIHEADQAIIGSGSYLRCFGYRKASEARSAQLWAWLAEQVAAAGDLSSSAEQVLEHVLSQGCLARRIEKATTGEGKRSIPQVYRELRECLRQGSLF